ncbi:MAG TPA: PAS domain S-box protein, partial [Anaeromyxobacteraceae bacterium]|nr:PAS domain S-box protein [Anaeromyxobacteraceae bacterium]
MGKANGSPDRDLLAAAIEESPVLIAITSFEGRVEHVNPAGRAFLGLDRSGADSGRDLGALLHPDDRAALAAAIDTLRRGEVWNGELRFVDPGTGAEIPTDTTAFVIHRRGTGEPVAVAWAARDVTQRRRMEGQLRESERRFREALENVRVASVMLDLQGRILFLNDHLLGLVGWRAEELLGRNWFELVVPDASVRRLFEELVPVGRLPAHFENEIVTRSGQRLLMAWHNEYLRDAMGRIVGTTSIGENVTERRQAERALAESERRYRSLVEDMPALVCRFRPDGVLTFVNQHYCDTFGFQDRSEVEGRDFFRFIPEPKREEVRRHYASLAPDRP